MGFDGADEDPCPVGEVFDTAHTGRRWRGCGAGGWGSATERDHEDTHGLFQGHSPRVTRVPGNA